METSTAKRIRTHGPNTSAVLHATGDLRLVSSARGHGVSWVLVDSEYSFSNVVVFAFIFSFLIQEERPVPTPEKGGTRVHSCQLRRIQTATALCKTNHRMCDQYNPVSCEWALGGVRLCIWGSASLLQLSSGRLLLVVCMKHACSPRRRERVCDVSGSRCIMGSSERNGQRL